MPSDPAPTPHWAQGLCFSCQGPRCTDCCSGRHGPGHVFVDDADIARLADHLGVDETAFMKNALRLTPRGLSLKENARGDCAFLEPDAGCRVYEARPAQCRSYPFWPKIVDEAATWREEAARCPGIHDEAERVDPAEIARRRALHRDASPPGEEG